MMTKRDAAKKIIWGVIRDLSDRRGFKQEWSMIDEDVKTEIINTWELIAIAAILEIDDE